MFEYTDPKTLTDEQLLEKVLKCREYIGYTYVNNSNSMMLPNLQNLLFTLEEEMNFRNQKKYMASETDRKLRDKTEIKYPINLGTIEGEEKYGKKDNKQ